MSSEEVVIPLNENIKVDNVIVLETITSLDIPPERVLEGINEELEDDNIESIVAIYWTKDGELQFASSLADGGDVLWMLEKAKLRLLTV